MDTEGRRESLHHWRGGVLICSINDGVYVARALSEVFTVLIALCITNHP